ncbi:hypothetical protein NPIL_639841 [Nephila pilipes]|uniref:Uncharacterized protein n=1 Tax=Nephila pilipes TaxID=299642 RepID=A0A8X6U604_NEPPI|nr:hypothetical protein NPIL_639841 [Nephila pilipes]
MQSLEKMQKLTSGCPAKLIQNEDYSFYQILIHFKNSLVEMLKSRVKGIKERILHDREQKRNYESFKL